MVLFQAQALWRLLFELLYFLEHGVIDEIVIKACTELTVGKNHYPYKMNWEHSGSVVECLTRDRGATRLSFTALWSLRKTHLS